MIAEMCATTSVFKRMIPYIEPNPPLHLFDPADVLSALPQDQVTAGHRASNSAQVPLDF